jgi:hypothetical protein
MALLFGSRRSRMTLWKSGCTFGWWWLGATKEIVKYKKKDKTSQISDYENNNKGSL